MDKEISFRIYIQNEDTGTIVSKDFSYSEIFMGIAKQFTENLNGHFVIGKSEFTGQLDCVGNKIYENDIVEFDANEWGCDKTNKHKVTWDNEYSEWSFGGGCVSDMEFRTVIGNKFENPELWEEIK